MSNENLQQVISTIRPIIRQLTGSDFSVDDVAKITVELYQTGIFRSALWNMMPGRENESDASLTSVELPGSRKIIVVTSKRCTGPDQVSYQGKDLRPTITSVFEYDGKGTITQSSSAVLAIDVFTGVYGKFDALLPSIRQSLGLLITTNEYQK